MNHRLFFLLFFLSILSVGLCTSVIGAECGSNPTGGCTITQNTTFNITNSPYDLSNVSIAMTITSMNDTTLDCNNSIIYYNFHGINMHNLIRFTMRNCRFIGINNTELNSVAVDMRAWYGMENQNMDNLFEYNYLKGNTSFWFQQAGTHGGNIGIYGMRLENNVFNGSVETFRMVNFSIVNNTFDVLTDASDIGSSPFTKDVCFHTYGTRGLTNFTNNDMYNCDYGYWQTVAGGTEAIINTTCYHENCSDFQFFNWAPIVDINNTCFGTNITVPVIESPNYYNVSSDKETYLEGDFAVLSSYWVSETILSHSILSMNNTGVWVNFSQINLGSVNESWSNYTIEITQEDITIGWIIYVNSTPFNDTDVHTFYVNSSLHESFGYTPRFGFSEVPEVYVDVVVEAGVQFRWWISLIILTLVCLYLSGLYVKAKG